MFKKILVPTDGSKGAETALKLAVTLAKQFGSEILIVHAGELAYAVMPPDYMSWSPVLFTAMTEDLHKKAKRILDDAKKLASKDVPTVKTLFEMGNPVSVICEAAKKEKADVIIMGSRGLSDLKGLFVGSVSHGVLQRSHCPVLLAKELAVLSGEKQKATAASSTKP